MTNRAQMTRRGGVWCPAIFPGLLFATALGAQPAMPPSVAGPPVIMFVHGRGQEGKSLNEVRSTFIDSFAVAQKALLGEEIVPRPQVGFVWYADAIDPRLEKPPLSQGCQFAESPSQETLDFRDRLRTGLIAVAQGVGLDGVALQAFTEDTYTYLSSGQVRCVADARLELALAERGFLKRPLIIVAHSMGGLVSYASISQNARQLDSADRLHVARFITMGTQVGLELLLQGVEGAYLRLPAPEPATIASWTNFINKNDKLAFPARESFKSTTASRLPRDVSVDAGPDRHAATTYLSTPAVTREILDAWCDAHVANRPAGCARLGRGR